MKIQKYNQEQMISKDLENKPINFIKEIFWKSF